MDLRVDHFLGDEMGDIFLSLGCITFVPGPADPEPLLAAFGANSAVRVTDTSVDAVGVHLSEGGALCFEPDGGYQGSRPEVLSALMRQLGATTCVSVRWNDEGEVSVSSLMGRVFREIDLVDWDGDADWLPEPVREAAQREFDPDGDLIAFGLALAVALTGVSFAAATVGLSTVDFFEVDPLPTETIDTLDSTPLYRSDRKLALRVDGLDAGAQRKVAEWVCLQLLELAELADDPQLAGVIAQFGGPTWPTMTNAARKRLGRIQREETAEKQRWQLRQSREPHSQLRRLWIAHWAGRALVYCCSTDAATAAWRALDAAKRAMRNADILWPERSATSRFRNSLHTRLS